MSDRILIGEEHIVVSKPGFDATNPLLDDADKVFDSDWGYNAALLFSGTAVISGPKPHIINFPVALDYVPAAYVWMMRPDDGPGGSAGETFSAAGSNQIYNDRIELATSGTIANPTSFFYMVFAL